VPHITHSEQHGGSGADSYHPPQHNSRHYRDRHTMSIPVFAFGACVKDRRGAVSFRVVKPDSFTGLGVAALDESNRVIFVGPGSTGEISYSDHGTMVTNFGVLQANLPCLSRPPKYARTSTAGMRGDRHSIRWRRCSGTGEGARRR
jgi:hypothetical protein